MIANEHQLLVAGRQIHQDMGLQHLSGFLDDHNLAAQPPDELLILGSPCGGDPDNRGPSQDLALCFIMDALHHGEVGLVSAA